MKPPARRAASKLRAKAKVGSSSTGRKPWTLARSRPTKSNAAFADGPKSDAGMAIEGEITLTNQERDKKWEYRVLSVNKAGEGKSSNTVMAML